MLNYEPRPLYKGISKFLSYFKFLYKGGGDLGYNWMATNPDSQVRLVYIGRGKNEEMDDRELEFLRKSYESRV